MQSVLGRNRVFCRVALTSAGKYAAGGELAVLSDGNGPVLTALSPTAAGTAALVSLQ